MARPLRIEFSGALYHITSRGNAGQNIFLDDVDRQRFLAILAAVVRDYHWVCYAYCLMSNHYHILVETMDPNLSAGIRQLNGIYTQSFNRRHAVTGHVFQGRFKSILVKKESHLLELCRYIVLNPVRATMTPSPDTWQWSSYRATAGLTSKPDFLSVDWILAQFSPSRRRAQNLYTQFILSDATKESPWKDLKAGIFLGPTSFADDIKDFMRGASSEIPKRQRQAARPELTSVIPESNKATDEQLCLARREGYSLQELADYLSIHYATVSRRARRFKNCEGE
jgi:putative transposase